MKNLFACLVALLLILPPVSIAGSAEASCLKTVQDYAIYRDALEAEPYANVFTENGLFITPQKTYSGHKQIEDYIKNQPRDSSTLHHITSKQITPVSDKEARGVIYAQVIFYRSEEGIGHVYQEANAIYYDSYRLHNNSCKIAERRLKILTLNQVK